MTKKSLPRLLVVLLLIVLVLAVPVCIKRRGEAGEPGGTSEPSRQEVLTLAEYLDAGEQEWFLTGKKEYTVQAMMVSEEYSFRNDLEETDYTVNDDGVTVVIKGTVGEMWASKLPSVQATYTKPDGSEISIEDFAAKDEFIDIVAIPSPDSCYAMFVPASQSVTVETAWGDELHTNRQSAEHGDGDYLVCRVGEDGEPDLTDVWVVNGAVFPNCYDTAHMSGA